MDHRVWYGGTTEDERWYNKEKARFTQKRAFTIYINL